MIDNSGEIAGILSERDVIANICREDDLLECTAARIMSSPAVTVPSDEPSVRKPIARASSLRGK